MGFANIIRNDQEQWALSVPWTDTRGLDWILRRRPSYAQTAPFLYAVLLGTTELQLDQNV